MGLLKGTLLVLAGAAFAAVATVRVAPQNIPVEQRAFLEEMLGLDNSQTPSTSSLSSPSSSMSSVNTETFALVDGKLKLPFEGSTNVQIPRNGYGSIYLDGNCVSAVDSTTIQATPATNNTCD